MQKVDSQFKGREVQQPQGSPHVVDLRLHYRETETKVPFILKIRVFCRAFIDWICGSANFLASFWAKCATVIFGKLRNIALPGANWSLPERVLSFIGLPFIYLWLALAAVMYFLKGAIWHSFSFFKQTITNLSWLLRKTKIRIKIGYIRIFIKPWLLKKQSLGIVEATQIVEENFASSFSDFKQEFNSEFKELKADSETAGALRLRPMLGFVVVLFVLILPFKGFSYFESLDDLRIKVMTSSSAAINELFSAGQSVGQMDLKTAGSNFTEAGRHFATAEAQLSEINSLLFNLAKLLPNQEVKLAGYSKTIIEAGKLLSDIGLHLTSAVDGVIDGRSQGIGTALNNFTKEGSLAVSQAEKLSRLINSINPNDLPEKYRETFAQLKEKAELFKSSLSSLVFAVEKLKVFVGMDHDTRYLLVFQNNAEMRASGGFFGSYALLDFSRGKIKNLEVPPGGTYDVEAGYHDRIIAPVALQMVNPLWHLWDANWWYDWPTTAKKLSWFYEKSGGPTVDGVISLTPTVIEDFLRAYGPVDLTKDYGVIITADNFWQVTQSFAEQKPNVTNKPKRIIGDLFNAIINDFPNRLNKSTLLKLVLSTEKSFDEKQALLYFKNVELADWVASYGWNGQVKQTTQDYLAVINSSVGGGKADREITQNINHHATVLADGSIIDEVEIIRNHPVVRGTQFLGVRNVDWLRIYVPQGSELIEASGFNAPESKYFEEPDSNWTFDDSLLAEDKNFQLDAQSGTKIYQELGKTVFANWSMIDPGETARIYFKYKLPFKATKIIDSEWPTQVSKLLGLKGQEIVSYGLLAQKQPGSLNTMLSSSLNIGPYYRVHPMKRIWNYPVSEQVSFLDQGWQIEMPFSVDQYFAMLLEKK